MNNEKINNDLNNEDLEYLVRQLVKAFGFKAVSNALEKLREKYGV